MLIEPFIDPLHPDLKRLIFVVNNVIEIHQRSTGVRIFGAHTFTNPPVTDVGVVNNWSDLSKHFTEEELTFLRLKFGNIHPFAVVNCSYTTSTYEDNKKPRLRGNKKR